MVNPPIQGAGAPALRDSAGSVTRFTSFSTRLRRASLRGAMALGALVFATGAGANSRKSIGIAVVSGMLASTCLAVLFVPSFFVVLQRLDEWKKKGKAGSAPAPAAQA